MLSALESCNRSLQRFHVTLDSPTVLATTLLCLAVHAITTVYPAALSQYFAWLPWRHTSLLSPLTAVRLLTHSLGHGGWEHVQQNLMLLCLVGPACERHYGSAAVLRVLICCSITVALCHWLLGPRDAQIFGLSGAVFALIMLNGLAGSTQSAIPASALLTACLWIAKELWPMLLGRFDGVSHASHLVGALVGAYCGYALSLSGLPQHRSFRDWLERMGLRKSKGGSPTFSDVTKKVGTWLQHGKTK
eukprot:TRINITY_DN79809_c0_g1_i1.p1 TRINITY_DN79809_c0_g1~~TRINITY_DN79809_c0_g1_i1.p1  ORF type:complete len:247 (+),score=40.61 TRINITY_DN79809_c0_g1_i1:49-789(+)